MDEFGGPPGSIPSGEEDFSKMPLEDRLKHKNWKARSSAYEELSKKFASTAYDTDPEFKPYVRSPELLKGMTMDSNVVAQEKGVGAVVEFVRYGGKAAGGTRETVLPAVVEKCLGSTRAGTKKGAIELVLLYAENEDIMGSEGVVTDVLAGLSAKQPKLVAGSVSALKELVKEFGPKQVSPKAILKKLPDIFAHSDKTVRSEGSLLAQELHKFLGPALVPTIDSLKDIQAKELRAQFEEIDKTSTGKPVPPRNLLSQRAAAEAAAASAASEAAGSTGEASSSAAGGEAGGEENGQGEFDAYEMAEPVDPLKAKDWPANFDEQVKSAKWLERKAVLEAAKNVLTNNIRLEPGSSFDSFIDVCAERIKKDATVHVWLMACQCLEGAAKGMRQGFAKYRERTMPLLLEKLKEKKASTVEVLANTLDAIFQTVSFGEILEDVLAAAKHKNPNVKTESIRFLARCLRETRKPPSKGDIKPIADALLAACSDGSGDVRDAGTQGMGTLMKLIGERPMNPYLDQLDDIKKGKVQEEYKNATVKVKMAAASVPAASRPPPAAASKSGAAGTGTPKARVVVRATPAEKENAPPAGSSSSAPVSRPAAAISRGPPARLATSRPPAAASSASKPPASRPPAAAPARAAGGKSGAGGAPSVNEPVKFRFNPEDAEARASELIPEEIASQLANSNWKERLAGIQAFSSWLDREAESIEAELIVRSLSKKPGWKESNFQVMAEVYKVFRLLAEQCPTFGRASAALCMQPLCDKLGDIKLKTPAGETLGVLSERTSFGFVLKQALGPLGALKAPKAIADSLLWIDSSILEFGIQGVDVRSLVDHLITCLKSANAAVRNNATTVMGTLARYLGSSLTNFLGDLNPQLKTTIEGEVAKATENPAPAPTRTSAELKPAASSAGGAAREDGDDNAAAAAAAEEEALDALIPRVDVDRLIPSSAISSMGDANWKVRKEALEAIQSILQANTRLKGTLNEVTPALKLRYADSNIMCKTLALDIAAKLATGLGKNFEPQTKTYVTPITLCLADAKAPLRQAAMATLTAIADAVGADTMISGMAAATEGKGGANPMLRQELFGWLAARFESNPPGKTYDLAPLALPAVQCLDDKLAAVKKAAQAALPYIIQRAGYKHVCGQADSMKAASKNTVLPLIDQARSTANALAPAKSSPAAAAAAPPSARQAAPAKKLPAVVAAAASSPRPSSPMSRAASPSPAVMASPRSSVLARPGSIRPPSAATRTLQTPSSRIASSSAATSGLARPSASSRLGVARKAVMTSSGSSSSSAGPIGGDKEPPFLTSDSRHKISREKKDGRAPNWVSAEGTSRPGLSEILKAQCDHHLGSALVDAMFSTDHNAERDFLSALAILTDFVASPTFAEEEYGVPQAEAVARVVASSDLIFKYIAIRLTDNNTSISLKCFELLGHLLDLLRTEQYHMSDYESNCILPCLIAKFGDAKVAFRDKIREAFRKLTFIFPPSKLLTQYVDNGLPSKNARTRAECLGELGYLFSKNGMQVCSPFKTLPVIAKQISDRDTNVRTAALLALGECYKVVGEDIWQLVGRLPEKEMSLLEERLKRTTIIKPALPRQAMQSAASAGTIGSPSTGRASTTGSGIRAPGSRSSSGIVPPSAGAKSRLAALGGGIPKPSSARQSILPPGAASAAGSGSSIGSPGANKLRLPRTAFASIDSATESAPEELPGKDTAEQEQEHTQLEEDEDGQPDIEQTINEILSSDPERSTSALKAIQQELCTYPAPFAPHVDQLADVLAKQFGRAFKLSDEEDAVATRLKKYLIQVSSSLFDSRNKSEEGHTIASYIEGRPLSTLVTQLLQRLIDCTHWARELEDARMYATYLNRIVIRCFGSCNLNVLYTTSFAMLADACEDLRDLTGDLLKTRCEFSELLMKCQWKVGRRLPNAIADNVVDCSQLLLDAELFLQRVTPEEWSARAADEIPLTDMPLRTIKVIITHMVTTMGEDALKYLDKVENPEKSHVYGYLMSYLNEGEGGGDAQAEDDETGVRSVPSRHSESSSAAATPTGKRESDSSGSTTVEDVAGAELREIFERISQKEQSRQAIKDLYEFQKRYPSKQGSIERSLQSTGPIFQRYIKRALANHAAEDDQSQRTGAASQEGANGAPSSVTTNGDAGHAVGMGRPSSIRSSVNHSGMGASESRRTSSTSSHMRTSSTSTSAAAEDRLAQLRAKFYKKTPASPNSSSGNAGD